MIPTLALLTVLNATSAAPMPDDTITLTLTMNRTNCRRGSTREFNLCSVDPPLTRRMTLTLEEVPPDAMEKRAYEATTPGFTMGLPGDESYAPWVQIRKSVTEYGTSITLQFRVQNAGAQVQEASIYQTVYMAGDRLSMSEPLALPADRKEDDRGFRQYGFTVMPTTQFAGLVRDPE